MKSITAISAFLFVCIFALVQVWAAPAEVAETNQANAISPAESTSDAEAPAQFPPFPPFPPPPTFPPFPPFPPGRGFSAEMEQAINDWYNAVYQQYTRPLVARDAQAPAQFPPFPPFPPPPTFPPFPPFPPGRGW